MKVNLLHIALVMLLFSCTTDVSESIINENLQPEKKEYEPTEEQVYVCVSPFAKKYHLKENCEGLESCTHSIEKNRYNRSTETGHRCSRDESE